MATGTDADANVSYYGVEIDKNLAEATKIQKPLLLHMSGNDEYVSPSTQASIQQGLKDNPLVTIYRYEGVSHGFSRTGSSAYRKEAAELARDGAKRPPKGRWHVGVFKTAFRVAGLKRKSRGNKYNPGMATLSVLEQLRSKQGMCPLSLIQERLPT